MAAQRRPYVPTKQLRHASMVVFAVVGLYLPAVLQAQESTDVYCELLPMY